VLEKDFYIVAVVPFFARTGTSVAQFETTIGMGNVLDGLRREARHYRGRVMKRLLFLLGASTLILGITGRAKADFFTLTFDENGNATVSIFGGATSTETGFIDGNGRLAYALPDFIGAGSVTINDPNGTPSDILNFFDNNTGGFVEFISQSGGGQLADTGLDPGLLGFVGATEDSNGVFTYSPGGNVYIGTSGNGAVPEPSSILLFGMSLLGAAGCYGWRRRVLSVVA
jgi:hypothetical protein